MKKYPKDGCIVLQSLTISWSEWHARAKFPHPTSHDPVTIMRDVSAWQKQVDTWMQSLSEQQQHDLMQLALAEIDMLYALLDYSRPKSEYYEDERLDFRTRFYELSPLVATSERLGVERVDRVRNALNNLERYATERRNWLP